ncbi:hypothetical protein DSO57_1007155 [Entomophthora muscae]|uniref:Uncharacterized protein n=1 Tax=Entomophthora muscae TaxID=34485 RepID=A0ACC2U5M3_9FUNG|nr:hypothetical protein DSO57_1007155 [Entomophthora muscae]
MKLGLYLVGLGVAAGCGTSSLTADKLEATMKPCGQEKGGAEGQSISCKNALPYIKKALDKYGLTTPEEIAFYISVMSVESGNLSYNRNISPGRPGQGTRSMMMPNNLYAFLKASPTIIAEHPELQGYINKPYNDS